MHKIKTVLVFILSVFFPLIMPHVLLAYPDEEVLGIGSVDPPFNYSVAGTLTGFLLTSDARMALSYGETLSLINLGSYALESVQPVQPSTDKKTDGRIAALAYDSTRNHILASQEDGDILVFDLGDLTKDPVSVTLATGDKLGPIAINDTLGLAYVADNTAGKIQIFNLGTNTLSSAITITMPTQLTYTITDSIFVTATNEVYFTTSVGKVFYISPGGTTATMINVDPLNKLNLVALASFTSGDFIYVVDTTTPAVIKISTSSHAVITSSIDISANPSPSDIVITQVTNPTATYAFVAGAVTPNGGISVVNTSTDEVFNLGTKEGILRQPFPVSALPAVLAASSSTDGIVYMGFSTGKVGIVTDRPFVTISSVTFSDGSSTLKENQSFTMVFQCNQDGTYALKAGGTTTGNGSALTDSNGQSGGSCTANTSVSVTVNYNDNSSVLQEGANDIWVFATSSTGIGRRSKSIVVDVPPPNVVITSVGFGTNSIYVNFDRLTTSDLSEYHVYVDTDQATVLIKTDIAATVSQPSSGASITSHVSDLTNYALYYVAIEAKDATGNISKARTNLLPDGSAAAAMPEVTVGPAGLLGENGCSLIDKSDGCSVVVVVLFVVVLLFFVGARRAVPLLVIVLSVFIYQTSFAEDVVQEQDVSAVSGKTVVSPQMWQVELKTGFWIPSNSTLHQFFGDCCNLITRLEGGALFNKRYGIEGGVGFLYKSASARGSISGAASQDKFNFILIPAETNFVWRADYFTWRYLVPFIRTGIDYVYFREGGSGKTTQGMKYGLHGGGGISVNIAKIAGIENTIDADYGVNDLFLTFEGRYQYINNFGGKGLDLSGGVYSVGLLFEF